MIERYEDYEDFVNHITRTAPLLKTEQLKIMISKYFNQDPSDLDPVLFALQRNQKILMSEDGWTMTPGQYMRLTGDRFLTKRNAFSGVMNDEYNRLPKMNAMAHKVNKPLSKSLWLVADMMPDATDFVVAGNPWAVAFTTAPTEDIPSLLYQIAYIDKGYEHTRTEMLKNLPKIESNHVKDGIRRICILEDETYEFRVPKIGFSHIVVIDHSKDNHYRIVKIRKSKEERWSDDPYHN